MGAEDSSSLMPDTLRILRFVSYEKAMPELMTEQMLAGWLMNIWRTKWQGQGGEERQQEEQKYEVWAASKKRGLQEQWTHEQVVTAAERLVEQQPNLACRSSWIRFD